MKTLTAEEYRKQLSILEKHLKDDFYKTGQYHIAISDAMTEYAEQFKPKKSTALERIRNRIPLLTKLKVAFEIHDYKNWEDGVYKGNAGQYAKIANEVIKEHQTKTK